MSIPSDSPTPARNNPGRPRLDASYDPAVQRRREENRAYYLAHRDEIRARERARRESDPERARQWAKRYRNSNREQLNEKDRVRRLPYRDRINERQRVRRQNEPEEVKDRRRAASREHRRQNLDAERASEKRWRDANPEKVAASRERWAERHPDYRNEYNAANRARVNAQERTRQQRRRDEARARKTAAEQAAERAEWNREKARDRERRYREANPEKRRESIRQSKERAKAADPEGYRERQRRDGRSYYQRHREEILAKATQRRRDDPQRRQQVQARYYASHRQQQSDNTNQWRADNPERVREWARRYYQREKTRRELGMPPYRRHPVTPEQRRHNRADADAFFARSVTDDLRARLQAEAWTPQDLITKYRLQNERFRADLNLSVLERQLRMRESLATKRRLAGHIRERERAAQARAEDARLDAIAASINARLRTQPRRRRATPATDGLDSGCDPPDTSGISL